MSLRGRLAIFALGRMRGKADLADGPTLRAAIARRRPIDRHAPTRSFRARYKVRVDDAFGHPCYTLAPRTGEVADAPHILYLHGGIYTYEITGYHWDFLGELVDALGATVTVPIYPLAPEHDHVAGFAMLEPLADRVFAAGPRRLVIMGDSAGGGLALALAQRLSRGAAPKPRAVVLLSPWVDLELADPAIAPLEARDPMLGRGGMIAAGVLWANGTDVRDPRLSPIHGPLDGLPPVTLLAGGREILLPDARRLRDGLVAAGVELDYVEEPGMFHVWPLVVWLPEARRAIARIVRACARR